jgi:uncharacterized metal-binding protein
VNGRAHALASITLALSIMAVAPVAALGCACGVLLSPDLDQEGISHAEWRLVKWTFGLGFLWLLLWWPYAALMPHRGLSHVPIIGTATRLAYLGAIVGAALYALGPAWWPWFDWLRWYAPTWAAGLALSDVAHWVMDWRG